MDFLERLGFLISHALNSQSYQLLVVWHRLQRVAVRIHDHLRVAVDGDQRFEVPVACDELHNCSYLWLRLRCRPSVRL